MRTMLGFDQRLPSDVVNHYVHSRLAYSQPLSIDRALLAIRTVLPNCDLSDPKLIRMLEAAAAKHHIEVEHGFRRSSIG
ncbi:MAG: hypothetical protein M9924_00665 [Rhizobiaceae bacterium]|nr:hypothetical protein [Rhizobiaceae bacterium]